MACHQCCEQPLPKDTTEQYSTKHDDVIKWKHFPRYWPFVRGIHRSPVNSPHKGQWRGALMFSLICVWINCWVNNREAGDLRRHRAHCDEFIKISILSSQIWSSSSYAGSCFNIRSKSRKKQDRCLVFSSRSEIWQAPIARLSNVLLQSLTLRGRHMNIRASPLPIHKLFVQRLIEHNDRDYSFVLPALYAKNPTTILEWV